MVYRHCSQHRKYFQSGILDADLIDANGNSLEGNQSTVTNSTQVSISFTKPSTCVTADTLVTLANGTQKRIDKLEYSDMLLVWDFDRGVYTQMVCA